MKSENKDSSYSKVVINHHKKTALPMVLAILFANTKSIFSQYPDTMLAVATSVAPFVIFSSIAFIIIETYKNYRCPRCHKVPTGFQGILLIPEECPHCGYK